jgi:hypothetical protein
MVKKGTVQDLFENGMSFLLPNLEQLVTFCPQTHFSSVILQFLQCWTAEVD